ncbi:DUF4253 domain-containing protein [Streptomyces sp. NPDC029080]|uniref:DUF4253 domain-containing protein n=1 Tax=Streptomyces sp. NPDC029080 TaxID=3155017 RepID=UPI0033C60DE8
MDEREGLLVAAEHFASCPDNVRQGSGPCTLSAHAERITGAHHRGCWWDRSATRITDPPTGNSDGTDPLPG